ncbi:MAG: nicotinate-nucleotide--dimethylbenzimidazole phosphoribosyltransferase [Rhodopseudomonas palustris]|uniref:Nicotinate-nucleotide--dimethylbenzimidazole phosphoribosyltransferase n=1 Tax=Rhodopseudomonas palustris TaxID=1076 RepID=A0A933RWU0_RHOPL|nr:nicotinate-nucleotide--dimethylbenzimidazole phosphoribosyltransferase [Rhodopseudomonas palustris]
MHAALPAPHFCTIDAVDHALEPILRGRIDAKAKPPGSLGRLEDLAVQLGMIWHPMPPRAERATVFIFAADHGIAAESVSPYPASVTRSMVSAYLAGCAGMNVLAKAAGADVCVVDAGIDDDLPPCPGLIDRKIARGTRNASREPAMTTDQARRAIAAAVTLVCDAIDGGIDIVAIGEMGIGNTTSAALITHRLAAAPIADCVGRGAGLDAAGVAHKLAVAAQAAARTTATAPLDVLAEFGGFEIAMMAGAVLAAAARRRPVVIDGFIASAAALVAVRLHPEARDYCVFSHRSAERGHKILLETMAATPYLDLGLRLGEGTGALMAIPLLRAAAGILTDFADLSDVLAGTLGRRS